jgi:hypothetical protein
MVENPLRVGKTSVRVETPQSGYKHLSHGRKTSQGRKNLSQVRNTSVRVVKTSVRVVKTSVRVETPVRVEKP